MFHQEKPFLQGFLVSEGMAGFQWDHNSLKEYVDFTVYKHFSWQWVYNFDQILKKDDTKIFRSNQSIKKAELCPMGADELSSHKDPGLHKFTFHLER